MMKTLLTACLIAVLVLSFMLCAVDAACAQNAPTPTSQTSGSSPIVSTDQWEYQAAQTLLKSGFPIEDSTGRYVGSRPTTRREFAVGIVRILWAFNNKLQYQGRLGALQVVFSDDLQANPQALDALKSLVDEFQPELQQLGQDVDVVRSRLDVMEARLAVVEDEQRRVKIIEPLNFIARGLVNTSPSTLGTKPRDKNGYRIASAGVHFTRSIRPPKHHARERGIHFKRHHRTKKHRVRHRHSSYSHRRRP